MKKFAFLPLAALAFTAACNDAPALAPEEPSFSNGTSGSTVQPTSYSGNFVSSDDDQVCYDMSALNYIGEVTKEMRGFKIDSNVAFDDGYVATTVSADGKYLDWAATNATVQAFIIKGSTNYHVYNYVGTGLNTDTKLHSPMAKKNLPQISHYNVCYLPTPKGGTDGCTPGYWRNHADRWVGVKTGDDFDATFGVDAFATNITLGQAIQLNGGGISALARHATAGLLNAHGGVPNSDGTTVAYKYTAADVLAMVKAAIDSGDADRIESVKNDVAAANEAGCPLGGTKAVKVQ